jgi:hypothetical protein
MATRKVSGKRPEALPSTTGPGDDGQTPLAFLTAVYRDPSNTLADRMKAASLAAPYVHQKEAAGGSEAVTLNVMIDLG